MRSGRVTLLLMTAAACPHYAWADSVSTLGDLTTYTISGTYPNIDPGVHVDGDDNSADFYSAEFDGFLSRDFVDAPGSKVTVSFQITNHPTISPNDFSVAVDGNVLYAVSDLDPFASLSRFVSFTATGSDTIRFAGYNRDSYITLSDVAASEMTVTPEPSSFALLGTGLLGVAPVMKRRFA